MAHYNWLYIAFQEEAAECVLWKKVFLKISQKSQENTCASLFFKNETLKQVFSCDFCEIFL